MYEIKTNWGVRKEQELILERFDSFLETDKKFLFIDAPVGTGKSYATVLMSKKFQEKFDLPEAKFDIITNTKFLQNQYLSDFPFMRSIKGMDNYRCSKHDCSCGEGGLINTLKKTSCSPCTYRMAKQEFNSCQLAITNFHMFINYHMYSPEVLLERGSKILFVDEAHSFEETFCDFIDAYISIEYLKEINIWDEDWKSEYEELNNITSISKFLSSKIIPQITKVETRLSSDIRTSFSEEVTKKTAEEISHLRRVRCKYNRFLNDEENWGTNWTLEKKKDLKTNEISYKLEATWSSKYLSEIWEKYERVVFLSGTILDRRFFTKLMGCERYESEYIVIDSPFPLKNRMIHYKPIGKMSFDRKELTFKMMIPELIKKINEYSGKKGIIHTGNYEIANWIMEAKVSDRLIFHNSKTREEAIQYHIGTKNDSIIVSPSMMNGIDLKDELSRLQIIIKVPYPNLSSKKVEKRMNSNPTWYAWKTLCDLIQSCGRSVRSMEDWADTYIYDENFGHLLSKVNLPSYIKESIIHE